jgi:hypothetical protein
MGRERAFDRKAGKTDPDSALFEREVERLCGLSDGLEGVVIAALGPMAASAVPASSLRSKFGAARPGKDCLARFRR